MHWLFEPESWIALLTLVVLEIVLGIDNIVFIAILTGRLPPARQPRARRIGLALAMLTRVALLCSLAWMTRLTAPLCTLLGHPFSGRDLILAVGGLFLLTKSTREIHARVEGAESGHGPAALPPSFGAVLLQIMLLDMIFSLDSVITAVGMVDQLAIMIAAIVISVGVMIAAVGAVSTFVEHHPTVKMLALSYLLLIGMTLVADGWGEYVPRGYIYFAMGFSFFVEMLNLRAQKRAAQRAASDHLR